jgi:hypothetical protein
VRRRLAAAAVALTGLAGGALALAQAGDPAPPVGPPARHTVPQVPGSASVLVPFGMQAGADGPRAFALGQAGGTTLVLVRGPAGGWAPSAALTGASGAALEPVAPVGGGAPQHAAELAPDGRGALLVVARARPGDDAMLLTRAPGEGFVAAPSPAAVLDAGEQLVPDASSATARALLAVTGGEADGGATFVAPTTADGAGRAVLRLGRDGWTREPIDAPGPDPLQPVALAAVSAEQAWLLARNGDAVVLLRRVPGTNPSWVPTPIKPDALLGGLPRPDRVNGVTVAGAPADPLTVADNAVWIDLRLDLGAGRTADATLHLKVTPAAAPDPSTPAPSTTTPPQAVAAPVVEVDGRWCDARTPAGDAVCEHPLGLALPAAGRGYRSLAFAADATHPFGRRYVSSPLDADTPGDASRRDSQRQGGYAALDGDRFTLVDGIGEDGSSTTQAIAFAPDGTGLTGGTLAFGATAEGPAPARVPPPVAGLYDTISTAALSPDGDGRLMTLSRYGLPQLYIPGSGFTFTNTQLIVPGNENRPYMPVRTITWPRHDLLIGVGSAGLLVTARTTPQPYDVSVGEIAAGTTAWEELPVGAVLLDVACTREDPLECTAVGRDGVVMRGDGTTWKQEHLPGPGAHADITSVRYSGRVALLATSEGLYAGGGGTYEADPTITGPVRVLATVAGGGAVVDGRWERDRADAPWRRAASPLELHPYAIAAVRGDDGHVRAIVSATPDPVALPEPLDPEATPRGPLQFDPSPVDAVVLRETADGWVDLDTSSYQPSGGRDLPAATPNTRVLALDEEGTGWMLGGIAGDQGTDPRQPPAVTSTGTSGWLHKAAPGDFPDSTGTQAAPGDGQELPVPAGAVRLAVGGHPACLDRCAAATGQGFAPDDHLQAAIARIGEMRARGAGPAALMIGGGRASLGGEPLDGGGARRYRALLERSAVPTYGLAGPGDLPNGGAEAFGRAFATFAAPEGSGAAPDGIDASAAPQPAAGPAGRARTAFAFDVRAAAGTVRVAAIDNAAGELAGGSAGPQARWIDDLLNGSRAQGIPVVVVGSAPLDREAAAEPARDAEAEVALLAGRASAYVATAGVDAPDSQYFGGALAQSTVQPVGTAAPLRLLQSATLGYSATFASYDFDKLESGESGLFTRLTSAAVMLLDVAVDQRDPDTNVAPVAPLIEPLIRRPGFDAPRTVEVTRAQSVAAYGLDTSQQRFLWREVDGKREMATSASYQQLPVGACALWLVACANTVPTDVEFHSSDPSVGTFVATQVSSRAPQIKTDANGNVLEDTHSTIFCPLQVGTTVLSMRVAGRVFQREVTVVPLPAARRPATGRPGAATPINPEEPCSFGPPPRAAQEPAADPQPAPEPPAAVPTAPAPVTNVTPQHHPAPHAPAVKPPVPTPAAPAPLPPAQAPVVEPAPDHARPPVSPSKPPAPPAPPVPPHGVSVQQVPVQSPQVQAQVQIQQVAQEQRREREAFESDSAAVAYDHPASPLPWELLGGAALVLACAAGGTAGRARRRAQAAPAWASARRR